jgi:hypothetical protein
MLEQARRRRRRHFVDVFLRALQELSSFQRGPLRLFLLSRRRL